jgi:hypothetical protein
LLLVGTTPFWEGDQPSEKLRVGNLRRVPAGMFGHTLLVALSSCSRKDVLVLTPWLAPIIWEGTFNIDILNEQFRIRNTTIGLTVFAIKK